MKKVTLLFSAMLLLAGTVSLPTTVDAKTQPTTLAKRLPTPETAAAFNAGRADARAWIAGWRARGSDATEY